MYRSSSYSGDRPNPLLFVVGAVIVAGIIGGIFFLLPKNTAERIPLKEYVCSEVDCVKKHDKVVIFYTGSLSDGRIFESSSDGGRMGGTIIEVWAGGPPPGFHRAIVNMRQGEEKTFTVQALDAYGPKNLTVEFTKEAFWKDLNSLKEGSSYEFSPGMRVKIVDIGDKTITAEQPSSHPLAGEDLTYSVRIEKVLGSTKNVKITAPQPLIVGTNTNSQVKIADGPPPAREDAP